MTIQKAEKIEIEVQKQTMDQPVYKYLILIKSQNGINKFLLNRPQNPVFGPRDHF